MPKPAEVRRLCRLYVSVFFILLAGFTAFIQSAYTKYPFKADFTVKCVRYSWDEMPVLGLNLINNESHGYDSLAVRIYFRAADGFENDLGAIMDICVSYDVSGFQEKVDSAIKTAIPGIKPVKISGTGNTSDQTSAYYLEIPLAGFILNSFCRLRLDLLFARREPEMLKDLLSEPPLHVISDADWSFGPHTVTAGDLIDVAGIPSGEKEDVDGALQDLPVDYYITVHRGGELLWGIPPDWQTYYDKSTFIPLDVRSHQDPMPYAPIAVPFDEYEDQQVRDSANLRFSPIRINQAGYRPQDRKYFYHVGSASVFSVIDNNGTTVGSGTLTSTGLSTKSQLSIRASSSSLLVSGGDTRYTMTSPVDTGALYQGIIPDLAEGTYRIKVDSAVSAPFIIHHGVYNMVKDALLKFYGINRCGDSKSWFHPACHLHDPVTGGWHDCGDHLKEGATMSYAAAVLGLAAAVYADRDLDSYDADQSKTVTTDGIPDILYEAKIGADFVLRSYDQAGGDVSKMITSVGDFASDHMWWGPPQFQDDMPANRGGPPRAGRNEATTDYLGKYAANLAFVAKLMTSRDAAYADRCLAAAKTMYAFAKSKVDKTDTDAYNGSTTVADDAAFGCLALLWATGDTTYLDDLCFDKAIGSRASPANSRLFSGGWFTYNDPVFTHAVANTDWGSVQAHVLWGFFRLILDDTAMCTHLGINDSTRLGLIEKTVHNLIANLSSVSSGTNTIQLPANDLWVEPIVKYTSPWFNMFCQMEWNYNKYQAGNITEMFYYYDIASKIQGTALPNAPATIDWKAGEVKDILVRQLDYMLGVNPWDISMVYGVGAKNFNHPHLRAANPELRTVYYEYPYRHPVGALQGGYLPSAVNYEEHVADYQHSETGIDATTNLFMPVLGLSSADYTVGARLQPRFHLSSSQIVTVLSHPERGMLTIRASAPIGSVSIFTISGKLVERTSAGYLQSTSIEAAMPHGSGTYIMTVRLRSGTTVSKKVFRVN